MTLNRFGVWKFGIRLIVVGASLCAVARAQAPAGIDTGSLTRWPPYVHDVETLERGRIVMSLVSGHSVTADRLRNTSLYAEMEFGLSNRLLLAIAGSTSFSNSAATKLDDAVIHLRYRFNDESTRRPALAFAFTAQRQTFLGGTGISPYEAQFALISEKAVRHFAIYGQTGYTTRNQPFQGVGVRRAIGRLVISGNYSYRYGRLFNERTIALPKAHPTNAVVYATAYYSVSDRLGLTAAVGRSFPSHTDSGGYTQFFSFGFGYALRRTQ
jgi:hypothetical protein